MRLGPCFVLSLLAALPASAGTVDCAERSLGSLAREAEAIVLVKVTPEGEDQVRLETVRSFKGALNKPLRLSLELEGPSATCSKGLAFLRREEGDWRCLDLILLSTPAEARALSSVVSGRLGPINERTPALFGELLSPSGRIRRDAALDLVPALTRGKTCRKTTDPERKVLLQALAERPSLELLQLTRRLAAPELAGALLKVASQAPHPALQAEAARALAACDRPRALAVWSLQLAQGAPVERLLGYLGGPEAGALLSKALAAETQAPRRLALLCALSDCQSARAATLSEIARRPLHAGEDRYALAVLARCSEGRSLRDLQESLATDELRRLAHALRRDSVELARRVLRPAEEELRRLAQERAEKPAPKDPR